ncbi:MAG: MBL fold metallo-hydrolase [Chloroflexi bacterium]|nr:MBL fold metallo-hydrolase [Chloroflexota bacterium]
MLFERITSEGLAHYSYLVADGYDALVIDPRRDCDIYVDKTAGQGFRLKYILETHRNEDYVVGSVELAARTGAEIWHADAHLDYQYGRAIQDGQTWQVGALKVQAIHTPGHTLGSMSYLIHDPQGSPWAVCTGDALFAGDVGRVDFLGMDRAPEMAGRLYDAIFGRLLPLGDEVLVCPAHGSGSACGSGIVDRTWTTIGIERKRNPRLQFGTRDAFVANNARRLEKPPYFAKMEELNLVGGPLLGALPMPTPLTPPDFRAAMAGATVLDVRSELSYSAATVPGALSIWLQGLPSFGGWMLSYDQPILLVGDSDEAALATRYLIRMGYDDIAGYLAGGLHEWHKVGYDSQSTQTVTVPQLCGLLDHHGEPHILDVRKPAELAGGNHIPGAQHIPLSQLPGRLGEVPKDRPVYILCGSGFRAMVAASLLQRAGWENAVVVLGGMAAWNSTTCPLT